VSTELKAYLDLFAASGPTGKLSGKIGSAFTSSYLAQAGNEAALLGLQTLMLSLGLVVLPYAPAYVASPMPSTDTANERDIQFEWAHAQGRKVAGIARALKLAGALRAQSG
jgi:multimeric flavodoxin WrbA